MIVSIHQPSYWPWLGLLDKIAKTDTFILLDDAQIVKGTFQYRNIFYCNGAPKYITIPMKYSLGMPFNQAEFKRNDWSKDHIAKLYNYYLKSPFFKEVYPELVEFYSKDYAKPIDLLIATMKYSFNKLGIDTAFLLSSNFNVTGKKGDKVLNLCLSVSADQYLSGRGSYDYMQVYLTKFDANGIEVSWHSFKHPVYKQNNKSPFIEGLGCLDIFFFQGFKKSKEIFWSNINNG